MAINRKNNETASRHNPNDATPDDHDWAMPAPVETDPHHYINAARLADVLAGINFEGVEFDAFEVYAHWSDAANGVVITVNARRKRTSAEMGRLAQLRNTATPGRSAQDVYEEWAATLETPLEYHGNTVLPPENIWLDLVAMSR